MSKNELNEKVCKILGKLVALEHREAHLLVKYVHAPSEKNVSLERKIDDVIKSSEEWKRSLKYTIEKLVALASEEDAEKILSELRNLPEIVCDDAMDWS